MIISEAGGKDTSIFQAVGKTKPPFFKNMTKGGFLWEKLHFSVKKWRTDRKGYFSRSSLWFCRMVFAVPTLLENSNIAIAYQPS